jgi:Bifunctional DNA primase/polymerase, N-terminal
VHQDRQSGPDGGRLISKSTKIANQDPTASPDGTARPTNSQVGASSMLESALAYAKRENRAVLPCIEKPGIWAKAPYKEKGLTEHGVLEASTDPKLISLWWMRWPDALIGARVPSHVICLDLDPRKGGTWQAFLEAFGPLPQTVFVISGRGDGGCHLFYLRPKGFISVSHLKKVCPGVDIKLDTGYTILPPSLHPDTGMPYEWGEPGSVYAPLPEAIRVVVVQHRPKPGTNGVGRPNARALEGLLRKVAEEKSNRNDVLYWASCRLVENHYPGSAFDAVTAAAQHAGLSLSEITKTINSAQKALS